MFRYNIAIRQSNAIECNANLLMKLSGRDGEGATMQRLLRQIGRLLPGAVMALVFLASTTFSGSYAGAAELLVLEHRGCPWCVLWHREVGPGYSKTSGGQKVPLHRIDTAKASKISVELASILSVSSTFVLVGNGREVGRMTGYLGANFFRGLLTESINELDLKAENVASAAPPLLMAIQQFELRKANK
jgi:hypothetical protein